ncbi:MAG: hypothetical protein JXN61_02030, partial [Sedimentisphaerales bacterium]|nr:hypothetical protein [Sedimentisphaerales bacterium]
MKTIYNSMALLLLLIHVLSVFGVSPAAEQAALWPSDALSKVMPSDTARANSEDLLQMAAACAETASSQAVFRP